MQQGLQALRGCQLFVTRAPRDDQLVFHAVLPAHQLGHGDLVAPGFKVQAAQHVGDLAAHFPRVQRVAPQLGQWRAVQVECLVDAQGTRHLGLAARHQHHEFGVFLQAKGNRVIGGGVTGVQGGDDVHLRRQRV